MTERQTFDLDTQIARLETAMWDYVTTGHGRNLQDMKVEYVYAYAKWCIQMSNLYPEEYLKLLHGEKFDLDFESFNTIFLLRTAMRKEVFRNGDDFEVVDWYKIAGLHKRSKYLVEIAQGSRLLPEEK